MDNITINLTPEDKAVLESYKVFAEGLSEYLGGCYEIVIHSFESLDNSVIKILNNHSGRAEGSPITDLGLQLLSTIKHNPSFNHITYFNKDISGTPLKSSSMVIRGINNNPIGMLCINFYMDTPLYSFIQSINPDAVSKPDIISETFAQSADDLVLRQLNEVRERVIKDPLILAANKNKEIITVLFNEGIFNLKDSVLTVAKALGISKNTVYMHIRNLKH